MSHKNKEYNRICPKVDSKAKSIAVAMAKRAVEEINEGKANRTNVIWLETSGCFGEVISLLNSEDPDILYFLKSIVNVTFFGSISGEEGEKAMQRLMETLNTEFIFIICGAIPTKSNGAYAIIGEYQGKVLTAMDIVSMLAEKAKYIVSVGTCACYGGPTAGKPNLSEAESVRSYLDRKDVIQIPGCPAEPTWTVGTLGYLVSRGMPELDSDGRPKAFFGQYIHNICPRRSYFDNNIFAKKLGDPECMFNLGCSGPTTKAYCPVNRWNSSDNWPIGDNTTCIGCAGPGFPDGTAPYVIYGGE